MLPVLLFFLLIAALCFRLCVETERRFEEILPLSCATLVLAAYLMGLSGLFARLRSPVSVLVCFGWLLILDALRPLLRKKRPWRAALRRFFTPAFFLYLALFFYLAVLNYGRLAWEFDALSHWADVVKAMVQTGVLSTSPLSHSTFQSYPPGMSLFQYIAEELAILCGAEFADWRLYHAFQVFVLAFLFPFLRWLDFKRPSGWLMAAALLLAPCFLYRDIYVFIYVDPVLGVLAASGLAEVLLETRRDAFYRARVLSCAALLVLVKDAGMIYALVLVALYLIGELEPDGRPLGSRIKAGRRSITAAAAALLVPWGSWKLNIALSGAAVAYPDPIPLGELLRVLTFRDQSYRRAVRDSFWTALLEDGSSASISGVGLTYAVLIVLVFTLFSLVLVRCARRFPERERLLRWVLRLKLVEMLLYLLSLLIMYLFKFSAYEALQLASLGRYIAVPLLSVWLVTLALLFALIMNGERNRNALAALVFCAVLLCTPPQSLINLTNRQSVAYAEEVRAPINTLTERFTEAYDGENARIYFLSQGSAEYYLYMAKYSFRPCAVSAPLGWSLGGPLYEGDVWSRSCTPEQLRQTLAESYDFVLVYCMNDAFAEEYAELFTDPAEIGGERIFRVDRQTGQLSLFA